MISTAKARKVAAELDRIKRREATAGNPQLEADRQYVNAEYYALSSPDARKVLSFTRENISG